MEEVIFANILFVGFTIFLIWLQIDMRNHRRKINKIRDDHNDYMEKMYEDLNKSSLGVQKALKKRTVKRKTKGKANDKLKRMLRGI